MLTVLIATRNGANVLPGVLEAYRRVEVPEGGYKLTVIDNGSTDGTASLVDRYRASLPLTLLVETRPGKNAALNRGLETIAGDLVVFTDDDAFPRADWLVRMRCAADANHGYAIFGGAVTPRWEVAPPHWIRNWVPPGPTFALTPPSLKEGPTGPQNIFGPNMAVRSRVFAMGFRFDPDIGPAGASYAMGSETELVRRLAKHGHTAWHVADAVVEHFIRRSQLSRHWILNRAVRFGRGQYRLERASSQVDMRSWYGVPRYLVRQLMIETFRMGSAACQLDAEKLFHARWHFNFLRGQVMEARNLGIERSANFRH